jgi:hypothetical protein
MDGRPVSGHDIENDAQRMRTCEKNMEHPSPHLHQSASGSHDPEAFFLLRPSKNPGAIKGSLETENTMKFHYAIIDFHGNIFWHDPTTDHPFHT